MHGHTTTKKTFKSLPWGAPAPHFNAPTPTRNRFAFSSLGGRFIALAFVENPADPATARLLDNLIARDIPVNDAQYCLFAVVPDAAAADNPRLRRAFIRDRVFIDTDRAIARAYGAHDPASGEVFEHWLIIDPDMRIMAAGRLNVLHRIADELQATPPAETHAGCTRPAPILVMPRILEPDFCDHLVQLYRAGQPRQSGTMVERGGRTVGEVDPGFKRRYDYHIDDPRVRAAFNWRLRRRLFPQIEKAFNFRPTHIERYIVACYRSQDTGFFKPHRDNTTKGTAHRRFAVTIHLNDDFEGGGLCFPEFGQQIYNPPKGGAVVFGCSLLHEARPVIRGERFCTLPFLYDDTGAAIRRENAAFLGEEPGGAYRPPLGAGPERAERVD
ncbi:2OG-Fe(II) oxygenase [Yunchengibacter salinarum]|uniref:2OG-Fe(II) oxygenase n=1 Tax=Yunchengibacter salinarum TaxID=3133399 RepID=UPI0035B59229